jgi:hypothetical protein
MALLSEILSDIELRVTAARPNDDMRFEKTQARFVLDYVTAYYIFQRARQALQDGLAYEDYEYDSSLWTKYVLDVIDNGTEKYVQLPTLPIALPINFGIQAVYTIDSNRGTPRMFQRGNFGKASVSARLPWARPLFVRSGDKLYLYNSRSINRVNVVMVGGDQDVSFDANGNLVDIQYPAPMDALMEIQNMVVQILLGQMQLPDDIANDGKDQSVKGQ